MNTIVMTRLMTEAMSAWVFAGSTNASYARAMMMGTTKSAAPASKRNTKERRRYGNSGLARRMNLSRLGGEDSTADCSLLALVLLLLLLLLLMSLLLSLAVASAVVAVLCFSFDWNASLFSSCSWMAF